MNIYIKICKCKTLITVCKENTLNQKIKTSFDTNDITEKYIKNTLENSQNLVLLLSVHDENCICSTICRSTSSFWRGQN